jgi:hypothetical protein
MFKFTILMPPMNIFHIVYCLVRTYVPRDIAILLLLASILFVPLFVCKL